MPSYYIILYAMKVLTKDNVICHFHPIYFSLKSNFLYDMICDCFLIGAMVGSRWFIHSEFVSDLMIHMVSLNTRTMNEGFHTSDSSHLVNGCSVLFQFPLRTSVCKNMML
jgi:hypothetical protein